MMGDTYENGDALALTGVVEQESDSEKEALERWWTEFNTADDNFAIHVYRKIPNTAKSEQCFAESVSGTSLTSVMDKCRAEYIPIGERDSEFTLKFQNKKTGKFKTQKNICVTRKNSDLNKDNNINAESQLAGVMHDLMRRQQENSDQMLNRILEAQSAAKTNGFTDFLQSPAGLALITAVSPTVIALLKPKEAVSANAGLKESMETMLLMKTFFDDGKEKDDSDDDSMMGVLKTALETMGGPLAQSAIALAQKPKELPSPGPVDTAIAAENVKRAAKSTTKPSAEEFLRSIIALAMDGARYDAPPEAFSTVILTRIEDKDVEEFTRFVDHDGALQVINALVPESAQYNDWFFSLLSQLKDDIAAMFEDSQINDDNSQINDEDQNNGADSLESSQNIGAIYRGQGDINLTDDDNGDTIPAIPDDNLTIDANESTDNIDIDGDSERPTGHADNPASDVEVC